MNHRGRRPRHRVLKGINLRGAKGKTAKGKALAVARALAARSASTCSSRSSRTTMPALRTLPLLTTFVELRHRAGAGLRRRSLVREIFDALAGSKRRRSRSNTSASRTPTSSFTQRAVDWMLDGGKEAYVFSREDFDAETRAPLQMVVAGVRRARGVHRLVARQPTPFPPLHRRRSLLGQCLYRHRHVPRGRADREPPRSRAS